ncbi:flagellar basal body protein [Sphingomonas sp. J344]|uniref:FlgK family flagellar hook-associated protein n=1 Tax=Sphingomonas sp. J344 TaxID=2898434 RepID=UPI0027E2C473|nr:flagellar basal body protein [Sphingomonas sp. J344]
MSAAQAGLKTVSTNIANVGTPGYARERANQSAAVHNGGVSGVLVGEPTRIADKFLEAAVYRRAQDLGMSEVQANYLDRMQALLGSPSGESSLPTRLDAITSAAIAMSGALGVEQNASDFVARATDAIGTIQRLDTDIATLAADADAEIGLTVERINALLKQVHSLNDAVSRLDGLGRSAAGTADQRNNAVQELSSLIAITVREQPNGRLMIETAGGAPLLDTRMRLLSYPTSKSGSGAALAEYPGIDIRFATDAGEPGAATGDRIDPRRWAQSLAACSTCATARCRAFATSLEPCSAASPARSTAHRTRRVRFPRRRDWTGRQPRLRPPTGSVSPAPRFSPLPTQVVRSSRARASTLMRWGRGLLLMMRLRRSMRGLEGQARRASPTVA